MIVYILVNLFIISGVIWYSNVKKNQNMIKTTHISKKLYLIGCFLVLFIVSAFRGPFTTDYVNYDYLFKFYNYFSINDIFQGKFGSSEPGYIFINMLIGLVTDDSIFLFVVCTLIILIPVFKQVKKDSVILWLSLLIFVTVGGYYSSFNIMRQIMAASIVFGGSKYLYERKMVKWFIVVLIAALIHKSSFIILPFYFILNIKPSTKALGIQIGITFLLVYFLRDIIAFFQRFIYTNSYLSATDYGMSGYGIKNIVAPIGILIVVIILKGRLDLNIVKNKVWVNACIYNGIFSLLGLKVMLIQRFSTFFVLYLTLLIPKIVSTFRQEEKLLVEYSAIILLCIFNYLAIDGSGYENYAFIWN